MQPPRMHRSAQRSAQGTQAPIDKQTHDQRQAEIFNRKTEAFSVDLPEDIKQAISRLCAPCKLLHWAHCIAYWRCLPQTNLLASSQSLPTWYAQAMHATPLSAPGSKTLPYKPQISKTGMRNVHTDD